MKRVGGLHQTRGWIKSTWHREMHSEETDGTKAVGGRFKQQVARDIWIGYSI